MAHAFESDATWLVLQKAVDPHSEMLNGLPSAWVPFLHQVERVAAHYQLAIRSDRELRVMIAKVALDTAVLYDWQRDADEWIEHLETIYQDTVNIRERAYALQILNAVAWDVDTEACARILLRAVQGRHPAPYRNPQRRWMDGVLTEHKVRSRSVLLNYAKIMILEYRMKLPNELARLILEY